jgi:hypothetical protein
MDLTSMILRRFGSNPPSFLQEVSFCTQAITLIDFSTSHTECDHFERIKLRFGSWNPARILPNGFAQLRAGPF